LASGIICGYLSGKSHESATKPYDQHRDDQL
jgi:hypothetical protein